MKVGIGGEPSVARFEVIDNNNTIFSINNDKIGIKTNVPSADVDYVLSNNLFTNTALRIKNLTGPILEVRNNGSLGIGTEPTLNYGIIIDKTTLLNDGLTIKQSPLVVSANQYRWDLDGGILVLKRLNLTRQITIGMKMEIYIHQEHWLLQRTLSTQLTGH